MAKSKSSKPAAPEKITLHYDLMTLPTAQHRAGLAGLVLQVRLMQKKEKSLGFEKIPLIEKLTRTELTITFTELSLQAVFDELYAAGIVEVATPNKWAGATIKRDIDVPDKKTGKVVKHFIYDVVQPRGQLMENHLASGNESPWLKLWRDMVWNITRGINTTRAPFIKRANDQSCQEGTATWDELCKNEVKKAKSEFQTNEISGALMLGAQAVNAENISFLGRVDENLLLHFWQNAVMTFVPQMIKRDSKIESVGFVLCIPDVANLEDFCDAYPDMLHELNDSLKGRRPAEALIDIPVQSNLEFLRYLKTLASAKSERKSWATSVSMIESFHMLKLGNNIKLMGHDTVSNDPEIIEAYDRIRKNFRNPIFRAACIKSLLDHKNWYANLLEVFAERDWTDFVEHEKTSKYIPRFRIDARNKFQSIEANYKMLTQVNATSDESEADRLSRIVYRLVKRYVQERTLSKLGKKLEDFKLREYKGRMIPQFDKDYIEKQRKVCSETFLAMRSRHDQEFVSYFVGSICSCPQFLKMDDYSFLTQILLRKSSTNPSASTPPCWEDVKSLAMIACAAVTLVPQKSETATQGANS